MTEKPGIDAEVYENATPPNLSPVHATKYSGSARYGHGRQDRTSNGHAPPSSPVSSKEVPRFKQHINQVLCNISSGENGAYVKNESSRVEKRRIFGNHDKIGARGNNISFTQSNKTNNLPKDENYEDPNQTFPVDEEFDNQAEDKENFPVTIEEITTNYPKPDSAPALTLENFEEIKQAITDKQTKDKVVSGFGLKLILEDLECIGKATEWLVDMNIDFYLELIRERNKQQGYPKVYVFHSFFLPVILGARRIQRSSRNHWRGRHIFVPVIRNQHWRLVVVKVQEKCVQCYDSMASSHTNAEIFQSIAEFLHFEYNFKNEKRDGDEECDSEDSTRTLTPPPPILDADGDDNELGWTKTNMSSEVIPQQKNAIDCGIFMLQYAEYLSLGKDFDFNQSHVPYFRKRIMYETLTKQLMTS